MTKARTLADLIADGVVGNAELDDGSVTLAKIANGAIGTDKIADAAVTAAKLNVQGSDIPYDNSTSGISANTLQEAIDYLNVLSGGGSAGAQATYTREEFNATAGQTTFTTANGYTLGYLQVFLNGIMLDSSDYTANDESTVVLATGAAAGDEVTTIAYDSFAISELLRAVSISASAPNNSVSINASGGVVSAHRFENAIDSTTSTSDANQNFLNYNAQPSTTSGKTGIGMRTWAASAGAVAMVYAEPVNQWRNTLRARYNADDGGAGKFVVEQLHPSNGVTYDRLTVDYYGRVTMPYQPAFSAYLVQNPAANGYPTSGTYVASSTGIGFTTTSELILRHTRVNIGNHYNTSTGRFTAPVNGTYRFSYSCLPDWNQYGAEAWAEFCINGSQSYENHEMYVVNSSSNPHNSQMTGSMVFTLLAGDYVSIFHRGGMHQRYTCFAGELIG